MKGFGAPASGLSLEDTRSLVRLLCEVIALPGDDSARKRHLMDGLCAMIGADAWAWSLLRFEAESRTPRQVLALHGGFDEERLAKWATAIEHPSMQPVTGALVVQALETNIGFTRASSDFVPPDWWGSDEASFLLWQEANLGSFILSAWPQAGGGFSGVGIYRNADRPPFDARECLIAHILLSEVPWLHHPDSHDEETRSLLNLPPRMRTILNLLVQGWSRRKIADHLGLSDHTVHSYVKQIFRHFNVHSQAELIARFSLGRGIDQP